MPTLHVVIPVFNEERTLEPCVRRVLAAPMPPEWSIALMIVDDCSEPSAERATAALAAALRSEGRDIALERHGRNRGKGAAIRTGFDRVIARCDADPARARDIAIIQDADLEYDPADFPALMAPILERRSDAVYGNRWGERWRRSAASRGLHRRVHRLGNACLTLASNLLTGLRLDDMECCYKLLPLDLLRRVRPHLTEDRFGIEPQITAVLGRLGARVAQVEVAYSPRGFRDGKKIGVRDALRALWVLLRERAVRR
ncbi:MAG TPA: glycosyltransferase family 2 protein [Phycisphaerales bacterium]|nr:glycosyltransferase family 2 protein [Phycisphaerales bacterium]HMP37309.1 glycosyltransferase family 2 protein [Phycisphaerales bacterium]